MLLTREHHARRYADAFRELALVAQPRPEHARHALHRYVVRMDASGWHASRDEIVAALRAENVGAMAPHGNGAGAQLFALPLFAAMSDRDADDVIAAMWKIAVRYAERS
jgi:dTDP-4-amino-4,6-dideoxygalactose transaminase